MMTRDELAEMLDGREYGDEMTKDEERLAKESRLLVVFGASDDLTEFRGIINDEAEAEDYNSSDHYIRFGKGGPYIVPTCNDNGNEIENAEIGALISAQWAPDDFPGSWRICPSVPHSVFNIMEDGEIYCRGAVIAEYDLLPAKRIVGIGRDPANHRFYFLSFSAPLSDDDMRSLHDYLAGWVAP